MRLSQQYQPVTLDDVVGQPAIVRRLWRLVTAPYPCCLLFEGKGGVGKSAAAKALIHDLGVCPFSGTVPIFVSTKMGLSPLTVRGWSSIRPAT